VTPLQRAPVANVGKPAFCSACNLSGHFAGASNCSHMQNGVLFSSTTARNVLADFRANGKIPFARVERIVKCQPEFDKLIDDDVKAEIKRSRIIRGAAPALEKATATKKKSLND
jgi:hypothetical protein